MTDVLMRSTLFRGCDANAVRSMKACLGTRRQTFPKGSVICRTGEPAEAMGLVLRGSVSVENIDFWGHRALLDCLGPAQVFAEAYAAVPGEKMLVDVIAQEDTEVLFLYADRLLHTCPTACEHHVRLIHNLLDISAQKNLALSRRILYTTAKSIRGRLIRYLSDQAAHTGAPSFEIPFDRQQLADYLGVDRSAMSAELGSMVRDGLIETQRRHFTLLQPLGE